MRYVINSYNTTSPGPAIVTWYLIEYLLKNEHNDDFKIFLQALDLFKKPKNDNINIKLTSIRHFRGIGRLFFRVIFDFILLPLYTVFYRPRSVLVMANYSPVEIRGKKIVIMRHSFLFDDKALRNLSVSQKIYEMVRRFLFYLTVKSTDTLIVQSDYVKIKVLQKYNMRNIDIRVLPNPISNIVKRGSYPLRDKIPSKEKIVLYVSRFHPHKNHDFIVRIAEKYFEEFQERNMKFYITIDSTLGKKAKNILKYIEEKGIGKTIINVGELPHHLLSRYYEKATCFFFPSKSESFGNPLLEAMAFGLPVIVPDADYAHAICSEAGIYYREDDEDDAYEKMVLVCENESLMREFSQKSLEQVKKFPTIDDWAQRIIEIMKQ